MRQHTILTCNVFKICANCAGVHFTWYYGKLKFYSGLGGRMIFLVYCYGVIQIAVLKTYRGFPSYDQVFVFFTVCYILYFFNDCWKLIAICCINLNVDWEKTNLNMTANLPSNIVFDWFTIKVYFLSLTSLTWFSLAHTLQCTAQINVICLKHRQKFIFQNIFHISFSYFLIYKNWVWLSTFTNRYYVIYFIQKHN